MHYAAKLLEFRRWMGERLAEDEDGLSDSDINYSHSSEYSKEDNKFINTKEYSR